MRLYNIEVNNSWDELIDNNRDFDALIKFVDKEKDICPDKEFVFRFLERDLNKIKFIILGMDPYPSTYNDGEKLMKVATGRAFEVANVENWTDKYRQVSLSNIFKALCFIQFGKKYSIAELRNNEIVKNSKLLNIHKWFDAMEEKGVLFLNASLTTKVGESGAHTDRWKDFMDGLIKYIVTKRPSIKWLIWGQDALDRIDEIVPNQNVIYACHPATRVNNNFVTNSGLNNISNSFF